MTAAAPAAPTAAPEIKVKPYKGPESYQIEDADLFYGREHEAEQLIAKILSSCFTLVHAQSGAGKTSLLNARVIPGLEARGWGAVRVLPQNNPAEALRATTLRYILPPPEAESAAVRRALDGLAPGAADPTLEELLELYDRLDVRDPRRRSLAAPVAVTPDASASSYRDAGTFNPMFCRLLRSHLGVEALSEHYAAVWRHGGGDEPPPDVTYATPAAGLAGLLSSERMATGFERLFDELNVPVSELRDFFENLCEVYGVLRTRFGLVVLLDQFEEMFTRFVDPGPASAAAARSEMPDWRLRVAFFEQFARLYGTTVPPATLAPAVAAEGAAVPPVIPLPVRYVISMRDEYIAQLDQLRPVVGSLDEASYHLTLLEVSQTEDAIREPAKRFGYSYSEECYKEIVRQLTKEDRYVEPAHLQLVCEKLWNEEGARLASASLADGEGHAAHQIPLTAFEKLKGTKGILNSFFRDFLGGLAERERLEALELLEPLVTASGTRNIIELGTLIDAPFRDSEGRRELLKKMSDRAIVRTERRLGGYFVEITHEFLIAPILEVMRETFADNVEYSRFRWAVRTLERLQGFGRGPGRTLSPQEFLTLHQHREEVRWNGWGTEVMIRSAILNGAERGALRHWLDEYNRYEDWQDLTALLEDRVGRRGARDLLNLAELRCVNDRRDKLELKPEQTEYVLRSTLAVADGRERDLIRYWTKRVIADGK
jgi:hypothetical protein